MGTDTDTPAATSEGETVGERPKIRWALLIALSVAACVVAVGAALILRPKSAGVATVRNVSGPAQTDPRYPGTHLLPGSAAPALPTVPLQEAGSVTASPASVAGGQVTLLYFGYTNCPDVCPVNMAIIARAMAKMSQAVASQVHVVFVTTDPVRDTPDALKNWLASFSGAYPGEAPFVGLSGRLEDIHQSERQAGLPVSDGPPTTTATNAYRVAHSGYTLIFAQDGKGHLFFDDTETPDHLATTLDHLVADGWH